MSDTYDVVVIGKSLFCDLIFTGLPEPPSLGHEVYARDLTISPGGAISTAVALRRLGCTPGLVAELGDDPFSHFILQQMEREGLDASLLQRHASPLPVLTVAFSMAEDRGFISYAAPSSYLPPEPDLLDRVRAPLLHFGNVHLAREAEPLIRTARERGMQITSDCQWPPASLSDPATRRTLRLLNGFLPNSEEARTMTGCGEVAGALRHLAEYTDLTVIKDGCQGVWAAEGRRWMRIAPLPVEAADSTGAGDCFNAGYLLGLLEGQPLEMRLHYGGICGACAVQAAGGYTAAPTRQEFQAWLRRHPRPEILEAGSWPL